MTAYYINKKCEGTNGHEVHRDGCKFMPDDENRVHLGKFSSCAAAVADAEKRYPKAYGCYYCSYCPTSDIN